MLATTAAVAGLVLGLLAGLWVKPSRQQYCTCGSSLECMACFREVDNGASPRTTR